MKLLRRPLSGRLGEQLAPPEARARRAALERPEPAPEPAPESAPEPAAAVHAPPPVQLPSLRGHCNVCGTHAVFTADDAALYRESLTCSGCLTTSRYRSIARGLLRALHELGGGQAASLAHLPDCGPAKALRIYDTQVPFYYAPCAYPLPDLLARCPWLTVETSTYRPKEPLGARLGPTITNQNLECLTFSDQSLDIVITSDVMEHVRLDARAHCEIRRVLKPGGIYLFTVPYERAWERTLIRVQTVDPDDPEQDLYLTEKEYHGDTNSEEGRALAYRKYGRELDQSLEALGFEVDFSRFDMPEAAIMNTELFYCRVRS